MKRSFIILSDAWYAEANLKNRQDGVMNEVTLLITPDENRQEMGEVSFKFHSFGGGRTGIKFEVFNDAWFVLPYIQDVLDELAQKQAWSVGSIKDLLLRLGFEDTTPRTRTEDDDDIEELLDRDDS